MLITELLDLMASKETTLLSLKEGTDSKGNYDSINIQNTGEETTNILDVIYHKVQTKSASRFSSPACCVADSCIPNLDPISHKGEVQRV